ncbi:MAG: hypothetical protein QM576_18725 [Rhodopseudomonas sp.]|uniref:hypothetical protein n=1 Tax=Rhodopseudomonas sp. TaxID=1078 RepID=UPI0039E6C9EA
MVEGQPSEGSTCAEPIYQCVRTGCIHEKYTQSDSRIDEFGRKSLGLTSFIDLRTGVQTSDTAGVLDGDLDEFMAATLA